VSLVCTTTPGRICHSTEIHPCLGQLNCRRKERSFRFLRLADCIISTRGSPDPEIGSYSYRAAKSSSFLRVGPRYPEKPQPEPALRDEISFTSPVDAAKPQRSLTFLYPDDIFGNHSHAMPFKYKRRYQKRPF